MALTTSTRTKALVACTAAVALFAAACSDNSDDVDASAPNPEPAMTADSMMPNASLTQFGPGCAAVPEDGDGSFVGMSADPVATAASNNPLLSTLVTAVSSADLVDTLNSAEGLTVFAPVNDAFEALPEDTLNAVLADQDLLTSVLTYHVVEGQITPDELAGTLTTLNGQTIEVEGSGEEFTVNDANIICGDVRTANATVYIIDGVLVPSDS